MNVNSPSTKVNSYLAQNSQHDSKESPSKSSIESKIANNASTKVLPGDVTVISSEAKERLKQNERVTTLLKVKGERIVNFALTSTRPTLAPVAFRLENDESLSEQQRTELANQLNQREHDAFAKYAKQVPPDLKKYYESYIEYLDSLSPEDKNADRYRGQRQLVIPIYEEEAKKQGLEPKDFSQSVEGALLFQLLEKNDFKLRDEKTIKSVLDSDSADELDEQFAKIRSLQDLIQRARDGDHLAFSQFQNLADLPEASK